MTLEPYDLLWVLIAASLVFTMQLGFLCLESGFVRGKNSINVAVKNTLDFCVGCLCFWAFGFALMFGESVGGWIGLSDFFLPATLSAGDTAFFLFQVVFCGTAATIVSGAIAERTRFIVYLGITLLVSGLIFPVFGHWAWGGAYGGHGSGWLANLGFIDFAGSTVVHSVGAWTSLAAILVIGPRRGAFKKGRHSMQGSNLPLAAGGVLVLWFSWWGFNGGSSLRLDESVPGIILNTNLAAAGGGLAGLAYSSLRQRTIAVHLILNGIIAGLVAITAACHMVSPAVSVLIGAIGGLLCGITQEALRRWKVDDVIGAVPAHGVAGIWGTIAVVLGSSEAFASGMDRWSQLGVQVVGVFSAFVWTFGISFTVLWLASRKVTLRVTPAEEKIGLNVVEHGASSELYDLLGQMEKHRASGHFEGAVDVEPYTEVGQIAEEYNRVIHSIQAEILQRKRATEEAIEARGKAEFANMAKDRFLANMSHEIRTPMNGILGMLEALHDSHPILSREQLQYADIASRSAKDLLVILNDILDLSRIESGQMAFEDIPFDLAEVVEQTIQLYSESANRKRIDLYVWIYSDVPTRLHGDPTRLRQVLSNILSNSIKFTEEGEVTVRISCARKRVGRVQLDFSIDDTGIGIADEARRNLFRAFSQADDSTTRKYGGSGLGLAIAKMLVERMGGRIGVQSSPGRGSAFWFTVDLAYASENQPAPAAIPYDSIHVCTPNPKFFSLLEHIFDTFSGPVVRIQPEQWIGTIEAAPRETRRLFLLDDACLHHPGNLSKLLPLASRIQRSNGHLIVTSYGLKPDHERKLIQVGAELIRKPVLKDTLLNLLRSTHQSTKAPTPPAATVPPAANKRAHPSRILLVEDQETNKKVAEILLKSLGYTSVTWATSGTEALAALQQEPHDLVLMDCQMPIMDGYEATREIRKGSAGPEQATIPIIALTAHALAGEREKCFQAGMDGYLKKPIRKQELKDALEDALRPTTIRSGLSA